MEDNISRINIQMKDGERYGVPIVEGRANELVAMASGVIYASLMEEPKNRRAFRKAARCILRDTRPDWISYLLEGWPFTIIGAGLLTLMVYGFCAFMHGVLGV